MNAPEFDDNLQQEIPPIFVFRGNDTRPRNQLPIGFEQITRKIQDTRVFGIEEKNETVKRKRTVHKRLGNELGYRRRSSTNRRNQGI